MRLTAKAVRMIQQWFSMHWNVHHSIQCMSARPFAVLADLQCKLLCTVSVQLVCWAVTPCICQCQSKQAAVHGQASAICALQLLLHKLKALFWANGMQIQQGCVHAWSQWKCHLRQHGETLHNNCNRSHKLEKPTILHLIVGKMWSSSWKIYRVSWM